MGFTRGVMKNNITASHITRPTQTEVIQAHNITTPLGVIRVDQDGNKYPSRAAKLAFLETCLANGVRSGNLKPITTENQRMQLIERIEAARIEAANE